MGCPVVHDTLLYRRRVGCHACGGDGVREPYPCPVCEGRGWCWMYRAPTPADLLTDPRVRALVAALRRVQGDYSIEEEEWRCVDEALAPFEGVPRG